MKLAMYDGQPILIKQDGKSYQEIHNFTNLTQIVVDLTQKLNLGAGQLLINPEKLMAPISQPRQIFAVGFNYRDHAKELGIQEPKEPNIFTKFVSSITGPFPTVDVQGEKTDWETELVVVIGEGGRDIALEEAREHIAGYMIGEDLSDRRLQFANDNPQFSLAKSYDQFSPIGPWLTTADELDTLDKLAITTQLNGQEKQRSTLGNLIFNDQKLVSYLSSIVELYPGDLIFTGTPDGVGTGRKPPEFIHPGDELIAKIDKLGELKMHFA